MDRQHTFYCPLDQVNGWRYEILRDGKTISISEPYPTRELAIAKGNEEACGLDGIFD